MKFISAALLLLTFVPCFAKKDKSNDYQLGTYVSTDLFNDGTLTDTTRGDGTTIAGNVHANHVIEYKIKVDDGTWYVVTMTQAVDSTMRNLGTTPFHLKAEKLNLLDFLKNGEKVMFRLERHRKIGGTETDMYIPFADRPDKEVEFVARFVPDVTPTPTSTKPTDNVKAMCNSGRLSPELQKRYCEATKEPNK